MNIFCYFCFPKSLCALYKVQNSQIKTRAVCFAKKKQENIMIYVLCVNYPTCKTLMTNANMTPYVRSIHLPTAKPSPSVKMKYGAIKIHE